MPGRIAGKESGEKISRKIMAEKDAGEMTGKKSGKKSGEKISGKKHGEQTWRKILELPPGFYRGLISRSHLLAEPEPFFFKPRFN